MEGVLMRSPNFWGMAVRTPTGELDLRAEPFHSITRRSKLFRLPIIRGFLSLVETLWLGMKALALSTNIALGEEEDLSKKEIAATMIFGIAVFMAYLVLITLISKDIRRFFAYHGAEHKAIKVYERDEELIPENARKLDTSHVRCGTSFVLYVLILSILVFSFLGVEGWLWMILSRVLVIPLVAGLAFEFIMWSAKNQENPVVRALVWPGLQLQKLTTREPTDDQGEVAMASLKKVLAAEEEARITPD